MKTKKHSTLAMLAAMALSGLIGAGLTAAVKPDDDGKALMKRKLVNAQGVLEGLALEDFGKIQECAKELRVISEEAQWNRIQSPQYAQLSSDFRAAVGKMETMAAKKNLDGATLNFVQVTMSCVDCHKLIRDKQKVADARP